MSYNKFLEKVPINCNALLVADRSSLNKPEGNTVVGANSCLTRVDVKLFFCSKREIELVKMKELGHHLLHYLNSIRLLGT